MPWPKRVVFMCTYRQADALVVGGPDLTEASWCPKSASVPPLWWSPSLPELLQLTPRDDPKDRGVPSRPQAPPSGLQGSISCPSDTRFPMQVTEQGVSALKW